MMGLTEAFHALRLALNASEELLGAREDLGNLVSNMTQIMHEIDGALAGACAGGIGVSTMGMIRLVLVILKALNFAFVTPF